MKRSDFFMVLPSNSCPFNHPNNTADNFKVEFQNPMYLKGNWEVALQEFSFVYSPFLILSKAKIEWGYTKKDKSTYKIYTARDKPLFNSLHGINVSYRYIDNEQHVVITSPQKKFNVSIQGLLEVGYLGFKANDYSVHNGELIGESPCIYDCEAEVEIEQSVTISETFQFKDNVSFSDVSELEKYMKQHMSKVFKTFELGNLCKFSINDALSYVKFDRYLQKCLGLEKRKYDYVKDKVYEGTRKPKVEDTYHNMLIYCSIVNPIIVGDVQVPLLKSIWFEKFEPDEVANIVVENMMYLPISTSCINNIEINIRDDSGGFIKFAKGAKTSLTLHFRKASNDG